MGKSYDITSALDIKNIFYETTIRKNVKCIETTDLLWIKIKQIGQLTLSGVTAIFPV